MVKDSKKTSTKKDSVKAKPAVKPAAKVAKASAPKAKTTVKSAAKPSKAPSVVDRGHYVTVEYKGTLDNGEEFDNSQHHGPINFVVGSNQVIKGFDEAVVGMKVNESKKIRVEKQHGYGDVNPQLVQKIPLNRLPPDMKDKVKVGGFLVLQSPVGQHIPAKVQAVDKEFITLDLNHPLAGKDLNFEIKVLSISDIPPKDECGCDDDCGCSDDSCGCNDKNCSC